MREHNVTRETIAEDRFWLRRPGGIAFKKPTATKQGKFYILEFKRMSYSTDQYLQRAVRTAENQYHSLYTALTRTIQRDSWEIKQVSFVAGTRSLNEDHLKANLDLFQIPGNARQSLPEAIFDSLRTKLGERIFDECANTFNCMYSCRFSGGATGLGRNPRSSTLPLLRSLETGRPDKFRRPKKGRRGQTRTQLK